MLLKGEAGPPDLARGLPLLQAAAAAHHPLAQFQLGQLYETGAPPLVPQNLEVARQLYAAAAERGMRDAAERLKVVGPPAAGSPAARRHHPRDRRQGSAGYAGRRTEASAWTRSRSVKGLLSLGTLTWAPPGISA